MGTQPRDLRALGRLREREARRSSSRTAAEAFGRLERSLKRDARRNAGIGGVWSEVCPAVLVDQTRIVSLSRGVLTVAVPNDGVRFEVDRFLRGGGLEVLKGRSPATLNRVKFARASAETFVSGERD